MKQQFNVSCIKVLMKDIVTPVPQEEVKAVIRKCLEQAALINYTRLSEYAKIEGKVILFLKFTLMSFFSKKIDLKKGRIFHIFFYHNIDK